MAIALEEIGKIKERSTQNINALGAQHIKGRYFSAEGFFNEIFSHLELFPPGTFPPLENFHPQTFPTRIIPNSI